MRELEMLFQENNLIINTEKTITMSFHYQQIKLPSRPQITFKNMDIACKLELRFLGIYITEKLQRDAQVRLLSSKLSKVSYF
jgi:hypothetical protein